MNSRAHAEGLVTWDASLRGNNATEHLWSIAESEE